MNVIIGFSRPNSFKLHGLLIEKIDDAPFDHAYMRVTMSKIDRELIFQSIAVGVQIVSEKQFRSISTPVEEYALDITDEQFINLIRFCIDNAGKPYGILDVIGLGIARILQKLGLKAKNPFNQGNKNAFCSQLIAEALKNIDPNDFNIDPDNVSPRNLRDLLVQLKIKRVL